MQLIAHPNQIQTKVACKDALILIRATGGPQGRSPAFAMPSLKRWCSVLCYFHFANRGLKQKEGNVNFCSSYHCHRNPFHWLHHRKFSPTERIHLNLGSSPFSRRYYDSTLAQMSTTNDRHGDTSNVSVAVLELLLCSGG